MHPVKCKRWWGNLPWWWTRQPRTKPRRTMWRWKSTRPEAPCRKKKHEAVRSIENDCPLWSTHLAWVRKYPVFGPKAGIGLPNTPTAMRAAVMPDFQQRARSGSGILPNLAATLTNLNSAPWPQCPQWMLDKRWKDHIASHPSTPWAWQDLDNGIEGGLSAREAVVASREKDSAADSRIEMAPCGCRTNTRHA